MPRGLEFTQVGTYVVATDTATPLLGLQMNKGDYQVFRQSSTEIYLKPLNGAYDILAFEWGDVTTPATADTDALEVALRSFFELAAAMTSTQVQSAIDDGSLPSGQHALVSDLAGTDRGAWLFFPTGSSILEDAVGLYQNCNWQTVTGVGTGVSFTDVYTATGVNFSGNNIVQWSPAVGSFTIEYSVLINGPFEIGEDVMDNGFPQWVGKILADDGSRLTVYSTTEQYPTGSGIEGISSGAMATVGVVGTTSVLGNIVVYLEPTDDIPTCEHWLCINDVEISGGTPFANNGSWSRLPRKSFIIQYDNAVNGPFTRNQGLTIGSAGGVVVYDDGVSALTVYKVDSDPIEAGDTITQGFKTAEVVSVGSDYLGLGYVPVSCPIVVDFDNEWVSVRRQLSVEYKFDYATFVAKSTHPMDAFPWGNNLVHDVAVDNGVLSIPNSLATGISDIQVGYMAELTAAMGLASGLTGIVLDSNSKLGVTVEAGVILTNTRLLQGIEYQDKTIDTSWGNSLIPVTDNTTQTVSVAPYDNLGA